MKYYYPDKSIAELAKDVAPTKMEIIVQKPMSEIPLSIPTLPYYNSMALNMRLADLNTRVSFSDTCCAYNVVLVVGTGGTGGFLVRDLARYISTLPYAKTTLMVLMDADEVEPKNLVRQNFINKDIGKNKAEVLAERYSKAFGVKIIHIPEHLTDKNINDIFSGKFCREIITQHLMSGSWPIGAAGVNFVVASCVDNNKTRALISNQVGLVRNPILHTPESGEDGLGNKRFFRKAVSDDKTCTIESMTWIDSGNESHNGQVICYYDTLFTSPQVSSGSICGVYASNLINPIRVSDANQRMYKNAAQYLYSYLTAPVSLKQLPAVNASSAFQVKPTDTFDDIVTKAAKLWMVHHQSGHSTIEKFAEFMKPIKGLNPMDKDFEGQCRFIVARGIRELHAMKMNITFPVMYIYPTIWDQAGDKLNTEMSCAERATVDPQNIMVNIQAASYMMNYFSKILASNPKNALLNSFGVSWNNNQTKEFYMTESVVKDIFTQMMKHMKPTLSPRISGFKVIQIKSVDNKVYDTIGAN